MAAAELARRVGVSRQTIYAMEAGGFVPNTAVALKLARALEVSVEELFHLAADEPQPRRTAQAVLIGAAGRASGSPIELCRVDGRLVGVAAPPAPWQLPAADALLVDRARHTVELLGGELDEPRVLIAGCDPAVSVLARHLARSSVRLVSAAVNSTVALSLLGKRLVHVAGTHLREGGKPYGTEMPVFVFAGWEEGLVMARGNPKRIRGVEDLARPRVRIVNREKGSGSRQLLDRELRTAGIPMSAVRGYQEPPAAGHLAAAWRVANGLADCCVATRSAARAFDLDFVPLAAERYDLAIRREHLALRGIERLLDTLTRAAFRRELAALTGYDTHETGRRV